MNRLASCSGCRLRTDVARNCTAVLWTLRRCATLPPPATPAGAKMAARSTAGTAPIPTASSSAAASASVGDFGVPLNTPAEVEGAFACSVRARTVSNAQLRRYLEQLSGKDYALALAAVKGAKDGGLRINAQSYEALLACLLAGGQLRASMELYQQMTQQHITPTPASYAALMELCLQRDMPQACQTLFRDLQRRGLRPSERNYELMITSLAAEVPPQWEKAIEVFDKIAGERNSRVTAGTYNALMRVYLNMEPFDWRIVYNCYMEMRKRRPRIQLEWESYRILSEGLRKGKAGYLRRAISYADAWLAITPLWSWSFFAGLAIYFAVMFVFKTALGYALVTYYTPNPAAASDSMTLPV